jgi:peptidoglycan/LPS O-acetylase OafA/YrhL
LGGIGIISYSLYLIHQPLIDLSFEAFEPHLIGQQLLIWTVYLPSYCLVIMLLSFAFYKLLEIPSISLGRFTRTG